MNCSDIVAGRFQVIRLIGEGGLSRVWQAWDKRTERSCVLKVARDDLGAECSAARESLENEVCIMRGLTHPLLPRLLGAGEMTEVAFIAMEYMGGEPLSSVLEREGRLDGRVLLGIGIQLCDALEYLHAQEPPIVHGDVKPGNVLLASDGHVRLIDFGTARRVTGMEACSEQQGAGGQRLGTRGYAAPECSLPGAAVDTRADIYGLGATLYRLAVGERFDGSDEALQKMQVLRPRSLGAAMRRCLQVDPGARFQNCRELRRALERCRRSCLWDSCRRDSHRNPA